MAEYTYTTLPKGGNVSSSVPNERRDPVGQKWQSLANHRPSAFAKQSAYHTIVHHQMSRRKSDTASARETVPPSLILPPAAE